LKSVDEVHQEFATQCTTYLETIDKQAENFKAKKKNFLNKGKVFDEVGGNSQVSSCIKGN